MKSKFNFVESHIKGVYVIEPTVYADSRGYFLETYNNELLPYIKHLDGGHALFVQENESLSSKGVLRGLHMQLRNPQGKLVRVIEGMVFDVAVDARKGSETYGKWHGEILSDQNKKLLYIPEGFLHGFLVLSEAAIFSYKCTRLYDPHDEYGIMWNDPDIGIEWPLFGIDVKLSAKDQENHSFKEYGEISL